MRPPSLDLGHVVGELGTTCHWQLDWGIGQKWMGLDQGLQTHFDYPVFDRKGQWNPGKLVQHYVAAGLQPADVHWGTS